MAEETEEELQERIKNMSPEELLAFQKQNCIFCHIISGNVPAQVVYKDDKVSAVLDINPASEGHLLVLPNEHYSVMPQLPPEILNHLALITKQLSHTCIKTLGVEGTSLFIANGAAAGQRSSHFMLHIIPRREGDDVPLNVPEKTLKKEQFATLKQQLSMLFNGKTAPKTEAKTVSKAESKSEKVSESATQTSSPKKTESKKEKADLDAITELLK